MIEELGVPTETVHVIATGGLAPIVVEECRSFTAHQPWLTLLGLELVFAPATTPENIQFRRP